MNEDDCCGTGCCGSEGNNSHSNGYTQKEMLNLILDGQDKLNERVDELHEKVNSKISRGEISGWIVAVSALVVLVNTITM
jgi:hypothetical protein